MTISLCMIVRDEEDVLARCLASVEEIADEIIVVDTGSVDHTPEIARDYGAKVLEFPWQDDFAAARNYSFAQAEMDYILWLDADDVLLAEDRELLLQLKKTENPWFDLVMMPYHVGFDSAGRPNFTYQRERLFRREAGFRWKGAVHEAIAPAGRILHYPAAVTHKKEKSGDPDRNLRIYRKMERERQPFSPRDRYYYGRELAAHGLDTEAAAVFCNFLDRGDGWAENCVGACLDLAGCYERLGRMREQLAALCRSFSYGLPRPEICCAIGDCYLKQNAVREAAYWYHTAADCPLGSREGFCRPDYRDFIPYVQLSVCYDRLKDRERALVYHEKAKRIKPDDPAVLYNEQYFYGENAGG